jgi:uncharacterized FAD-dependent dehydrogenase
MTGAGMRLLTISNLKLPINADEKQLLLIARKKLGANPAYFAIKKKSLDARDKNNIHYIYTIECADAPLPKEEELARLSADKQPKEKVLIVGSGPAGLFCAVRLIDRGIRPILIERGGSVEERESKINAFFTTKFLDTQTNIQFGEGGAGTFSDGKLNTQTHSTLNKEVLKTFVRFGAPEEILYLSKPHIGSDNLKMVVKNMREYIQKQGGEVLFNTRLEDIIVQDKKLTHAVVKKLNAYTGGGNAENLQSAPEKIPVSALVLAIGHSARDTFEKLLSRGVLMHAKNFAVGVRIEHLQRKIGQAQYGKAYSQLPPADYKLVSHAKDRAAFTFCMCPGGYVMPSASEEGGVVTNGMSNYARDGENANSALIVQVTQEDFGTDAPLGGVEFQRRLERAAFTAGGKNYAAPTQLVGDFLQNKTSTHFGEVQPTYAAGTAFANLNEVLPKPISETLAFALTDMDRKLRGFASPDAILTAVESRTSSPVRIERDESLQSVSVKGLYPCGEGAGYAGGITSSAADGLRVAERLFTEFNEN